MTYSCQTALVRASAPRVLCQPVKVELCCRMRARTWPLSWTWAGCCCGIMAMGFWKVAGFMVVREGPQPAGAWACRAGVGRVSDESK